MEFIAILFCSLAIVRYSSAQQISPATTSAYTTASAYTTSSTIFLPSALFNPFPVPQSFTGQVTTTDSTTYYSLTYELGLSFFNPYKYPHTVGDFDNVYSFSASVFGTEYTLPEETTVNCSPTHSGGTAACTTFYPGVVATSGFDGPSYWKIDNAESSVYLAYFTSSEPFPPATVTAAAAFTSSTLATEPSSSSSSTTLSPATRIFVGLGVPLGVCACAVLGLLLLLRHRRHKMLFLAGRANAVAASDDYVVGDIEDKMTAEGGNGDGSGEVSELHGMEGRGAANELEGSVGEGRNELA